MTVDIEGGRTLHVVHCVDTEGPLYESLEASFERLDQALGVRLEPTQENLLAIRERRIDLNGSEEFAARLLSEELLTYCDTWDKLDRMLDEMLSPEYRSRHADSRGRGWTFSWFVMDHVGYDTNPRRRDIGYHNILDHYRRRLRASGCEEDELHWHFHPMSTYREAHICATSFLRSPHLLEGLARLVIDRLSFPTCFRAGFHAERPDSHWFLEQWIPFDFSNQAVAETAMDQAQQDLGRGRFGDWRRAPSDWSPYHPSHDDYQVPGTCRRIIFRCLNVGTRLRLLTPEEVDRAFSRAASGKPTVLAFTNHDFRDMRADVTRVYDMLTEAGARHPQVAWRHSGARQAARDVLNIRTAAPPEIRASFEDVHEGVRMTVRSDSPLFGPQPFLAVRTHDKRYVTDNFDFQVPGREWSYTFDRQTIPRRAVDRIGIAASCADGSWCVAVYDADGRLLERSGD